MTLLEEKECILQIAPASSLRWYDTIYKKTYSELYTSCKYMCLLTHMTIWGISYKLFLKDKLIVYIYQMAMVCWPLIVYVPQKLSPI